LRPVKTQRIQQFELTPLARAGVFVMNLQRWGGESGHDLFSPHRDAHFLLVLATHGGATLHLDFAALPLQAPALLLVFPGQVHHVGPELRELRGWSVSFDGALLDAQAQLVLERGLQHPLAPDPESAFFQQACALLALLEQVQAGPADAYTGRSTHALLTALLSLIAGQLTSAEGPGRESRGAVIERGFRQLLKQHYQQWKQPAQYAAALAVSVAHLNDTLRQLTGLSTSAHIQQRAVLEAKRLLCFTELSAKEIGYAVGYDEPVYFGKLFRKSTGLTPQQFRRQFRE
jgi:AraC-like DNA-binding protein